MRPNVHTLACEWQTPGSKMKRESKLGKKKNLKRVKRESKLGKKKPLKKKYISKATRLEKAEKRI